METQRGETACPRSSDRKMVELILESSLAHSEGLGLTSSPERAPVLFCSDCSVVSVRHVAGDTKVRRGGGTFGCCQENTALKR